MTKITYHAHINSPKSQKLLGLKVYQGYATVWENGKYLYTAYCPITRLNPEDAINDAKSKIDGLEVI